MPKLEGSFEVQVDREDISSLVVEDWMFKNGGYWFNVNEYVALTFESLELLELFADQLQTFVRAIKLEEENLRED